MGLDKSTRYAPALESPATHWVSEAGLLYRFDGIKWIRIKGSYDKDGYPRIDIAGLRRYLHQIVLGAFVGPRPAGLVGSHLNGDPSDNRPANLAYESVSENNLRKIEHGTHGVKLSEKEVVEIKRAYSGERGQLSTLADRYGVSKVTIFHIVTGETWKHV